MYQILLIDTNIFKFSKSTPSKRITAAREVFFEEGVRKVHLIKTIKRTCLNSINKIVLSMYDNISLKDVAFYVLSSIFKTQYLPTPPSDMSI